MQWFDQIPGVESLTTGQEFFDFFHVSYEIERLNGRQLHILKDFNQRIANVADVQADAAFATAGELLAQAYEAQTQEEIASHSPLAVYQRLRPSRVSLSSLVEDDDE